MDVTKSDRASCSCECPMSFSWIKEILPNYLMNLKLTDWKLIIVFENPRHSVGWDSWQSVPLTWASLLLTFDSACCSSPNIRRQYPTSFLIAAANCSAQNTITNWSEGLRMHGPSIATLICAGTKSVPTNRCNLRAWVIHLRLKTGHERLTLRFIYWKFHQSQCVGERYDKGDFCTIERHQLSTNQYTMCYRRHLSADVDRL